MMSKKPLIVLNFKLYKESSGKKSLSMVQKIAKAGKNGYEVIVAPSLATMALSKTNLTIFAQHVDPVGLGSNTGKISIDELKDLGIKGTLINHSERKVPMSILKQVIAMCKQKKFTVIACASSLGEVKKISAMNPDYIAYEPPELIGGDISVCEANPTVIVKAAEIVKTISKKTKLLCGAGIHDQKDVGQALVLGASGVLIGHAVPQAKNPKKFLEELLL
jgi:triosephosphate isomerase (TIM)